MPGLSSGWAGIQPTFVGQQSSRHATDENKDDLQGFQELCADDMKQSSTLTAMHDNYFQLTYPIQDTLGRYRVQVDHRLSKDRRRL